MSESLVYKICIPNTLHDTFDYEAPYPLLPGVRVLVPFRKGLKLGVVIEANAASLHLDKLKSIHKVLDSEPLIDNNLLQLIRWGAQYYQSPLSQLMKLALPKKLRNPTPLKKPKPLSLEKNQGQDEALILNDEQQEAVEKIQQALGHFQGFLLQGVTGSGKTEVYLQTIALLLKDNKQVLILVPEIGLTPQLIQRFKARFQVPIVSIHSHLSEGERFKAWFWASNNIAKIIIGTRTAVFTPLPALGLIVIDEEHDPSFKQMEGVRYSARDMAVMRALWAKIPIVLGSATPSLESLNNSLKNKYIHLHLRHRAKSVNQLQFDIIDLRNQPLQHGLAPKTIETIETHLEKKNQVLVFINQRGFSPILYCAACTSMVDCSHCDAHLTVHKKMGILICHHCGKKKPIPKCCPRCGSIDLIPVGIGTQRLYESLESLFPNIKVLRIDRDTVKRKEELSQKLKQIRDRDVQLIIGTQMLAKGHDFPFLSLVVIVNADVGFCSPDFRATEQIGQLLTQVAGRAGRAEEKGQVILQTLVPKHPLLNLLIQQGYDLYAKTLLKNRELASLPPYYYLALIRAEDKDQQRLVSGLMMIKGILTAHSLLVLGPAPAPLSRKANLYRMQLLIKESSRKKLQLALQATRDHISVDKKLHNFCWHIDVDPINLD